jgi:RNase P subunit RPR2
MKDIFCIRCNQKLGSAVIENGKMVRINIGAMSVKTLHGRCAECGTTFHFRTADDLRNDYSENSSSEGGSSDK